MKRYPSTSLKIVRQEDGPTPTPDGFNRDWWDLLHFDWAGAQPLRDIYIVAMDDDMEVARCLIADRSVPSTVPEYPMPASTKPRVEVVLFEVTASRRRQGIGHAVIRLLEQDFPGRSFGAYVDGSTAFWDAERWDRQPGPSANGLPLYLHVPRPRGPKGRRLHGTQAAASR